MPTLNDIQTWQGREVLGRDGDKIGTVTDVTSTGRPAGPSG
jgi:sporulation protein YlmC with PRC-barrel domain